MRREELNEMRRTIAYLPVPTPCPQSAAPRTLSRASNVWILVTVNGR